MSWKNGLFWFGGMFVFSVGYASVHSVEEAAILIGFLMMITGYMVEWNNE